MVLLIRQIHNNSINKINQCEYIYVYILHHSQTNYLYEYSPPPSGNMSGGANPPKNLGRNVAGGIKFGDIEADEVS